MLNFIRKLFGEGTIRANAVFETGEKGVIKIPYTGDINTLDWAELKQEIANQMLVEHGLILKSLTYVAHT